MYSRWTSNLQDPEDKEKFQKQIVRSKPVLDRIKEILDQTEKEDLDRSELSIKTFDSPNWHFRQAYVNGYRACIKSIRLLVDLDQQKEI